MLILIQDTLLFQEVSCFSLNIYKALKVPFISEPSASTLLLPRVVGS